MRANGAPTFPHPNAQGVIVGKSDAGLDLNSPQFQKADKTCAKNHQPRRNPAQAGAAGQATGQRHSRSHSVHCALTGEPELPRPKVEPEAPTHQNRRPLWQGPGQSSPTIRRPKWNVTRCATSRRRKAGPEPAAASQGHDLPGTHRLSVLPACTQPRPVRHRARSEVPPPSRRRNELCWRGSPGYGPRSAEHIQLPFCWRVSSRSRLRRSLWGGGTLIVAER